MCGIFAFWARESVPSEEVFYWLIKEAEKRGQDGTSFAIIRDGEVILTSKFGSVATCVREIKEFMKVEDILLLSCRATPETEKETNSDMLQPVKGDKAILIHNGGVTESVRVKDYDYKTEIDSEIILAAYEKHNYNMKQTMEYLSGSFAFVMLDVLKKKLYSVCSFNPLAHMYVKGVGYFLHSNNDALGKALQLMTGCSKDGMNVWENWYHH
ncbi:MAG: hypothetical protein DRP42_05165, partial [Tenericutes bacterium]